MHTHTHTRVCVCVCLSFTSKTDASEVDSGANPVFMVGTEQDLDITLQAIKQVSIL